MAARSSPQKRRRLSIDAVSYTARLVLIRNTERSLYKNKTNVNVTWTNIENPITVQNDLIALLRAAKMDEDINHYEFCYSYDVDRDKGTLIVDFDIGPTTLIDWSDENLVFVMNQIANEEKKKDKAKSKEELRAEQKQRHKDSLTRAKQELQLFFEQKEQGLWSLASSVGIDLQQT